MTYTSGGGGGGGAGFSHPAATSANAGINRRVSRPTLIVHDLSLDAASDAFASQGIELETQVLEQVNQFRAMVFDAPKRIEPDNVGGQQLVKHHTGMRRSFGAGSEQVGHVGARQMTGKLHHHPGLVARDFDSAEHLPRMSKACAARLRTISGKIAVHGHHGT